MLYQKQSAKNLETLLEKKVINTERDYYKILLVGSSGKGKTYSFRNMHPETTGFINVENKPLPFKNKFKYHAKTNSYLEAYDMLAEYAKNPEIDCIVFDSFSAYLDLLLGEARKAKKGFDIWNMYNEEVGKLLNRIKRIPKEIFVTAHYEILGIEGSMEKRTKIKGKEWEGMVEKEFTVVLYADSKLSDKGVPEYWYNTFQESTSTKCNPDLIKALKIENDCSVIFNLIQKYTS